jgi:predicted dehydrogenase
VKTDRKIKLGIIGCGDRGSWLGGFFQRHGGFEIHALADCFSEEVNEAGKRLGVDKSRRFAGLMAYKRLLDSGVDAVVIVNVPHFYPAQARAAVDAGCHVWLSKPIAVDVPGCLAIREAGRLATEKKRCFLVDYQMRTDPVIIDVVQRIREGALGRLAHLGTTAFNIWVNDPPRGQTNESLLRRGCWASTIALCGDTIVEYSIHIVDTALWIVGRRPTSATGEAIRCRQNAHGDRNDAVLVTYRFDDGPIWSHRTQSFNNNEDTILRCNAYGEVANAQLGYWGKSFIRGGPKHVGARDVASLYDQGVWRNIATFYQSITEQRCENTTVEHAVDGVLTAILGREAATRGQRLTMDDLLKENKKLEFDLGS